MNNLSELLDVTTICPFSKRLKLSKESLILCIQKRGRKLQYKIPFLEDKEVCVGMETELNPNKSIPYLKVNVDKMGKCRYNLYKKK